MAHARNEASKHLTRVSLETALVDILADRPLEAVRIGELCRRAGVSRMAFYRHYGTVVHVVRARLVQQREEFLAWLRSAGDPGPRDLGLRFLDWVETDRVLFGALRDAHHQWLLFDFLHQGLVDFVRHEGARESLVRETSGLEGEYAMRFVAGGLLAVLTRWLDGGCSDPKGVVLDMVLPSMGGAGGPGAR